MCASTFYNLFLFLFAARPSPDARRHVR